MPGEFLITDDIFDSRVLRTSHTGMVHRLRVVSIKELTESFDCPRCGYHGDPDCEFIFDRNGRTHCGQPAKTMQAFTPMTTTREFTSVRPCARCWPSGVPLRVLAGLGAL